VCDGVWTFLDHEYIDEGQGWVSSVMISQGRRPCALFVYMFWIKLWWDQVLGMCRRQSLCTFSVEHHLCSRADQSNKEAA
jgi:hypothetical protein